MNTFKVENNVVFESSKVSKSKVLLPLWVKKRPSKFNKRNKLHHAKGICIYCRNNLTCFSRSFTNHFIPNICPFLRTNQFLPILGGGRGRGNTSLKILIFPNTENQLCSPYVNKSQCAQTSGLLHVPPPQHLEFKPNHIFTGNRKTCYFQGLGGEGGGQSASFIIHFVVFRVFRIFLQNNLREIKKLYPKHGCNHYIFSTIQRASLGLR